MVKQYTCTVVELKINFCILVCMLQAHGSWPTIIRLLQTSVRFVMWQIRSNLGIKTGIQNTVDGLQLIHAWMKPNVYNIYTK